MKKIFNTRVWHRRLGIIFCFFVLLASGSGILHNVLTWTQSPPPRPLPSASLDPKRLTFPLSALTGRWNEPITLVTIRELSGKPVYQIFREGISVPTYVSAETGIDLPDADALLAAEIASRHLGGIPVRQTDYLTAFNREYLSIFRILPVYRLDADDPQGTRVYVSTLTGSVTRHTDHHRQLNSTLFSLLHKFAFIPNKNIRNSVLTATTFGIFITALAGMLLYFKPRASKSTPS
ncbi:MAG: hypothetical protein ACFCUX_06145 [Candidatus Methylacidiphilales bacterium]